MAYSPEVLNFLSKNYGDKIYSMGNLIQEGQKLSVGIFPIDFALNGGLPLGKISHIFGPKDACKTTLALSITGFMQLKGLQCFYIDVENTFDPLWASKLGVQCDKLIVFQPNSGEQIVDIIDGLMQCDDIHFGVLDSLGAIITTNEIESYGSKMIVAGSSGVIAKIMRKAIHAQIEQSKKGYYPTLLCINQVRSKIGVLYGSPEYAPGGALVEHAPSLNLRISGKPIIDKHYNPNVPVKHHVSMTVKKSKMKTILQHIEFEIGLDDIGDLKTGKANDSEIMLKYLKAFNLIEKEGTEYSCCGETYKSQKELKEQIEQDSNRKNQIQQILFQHGQTQFMIEEE